MEAEGCIRGRQRQTEQTELIGGRQTKWNLLERGRVVGVLNVLQVDGASEAEGCVRVAWRWMEWMEVDRASCDSLGINATHPELLDVIPTVCRTWW
jgi:hypothetical protein